MALYVKGLKLVFTVIAISAILLLQQIEGHEGHHHAPASAPGLSSHAVGIKQSMTGYAFVLVGMIFAILV
ncbi:hypothetical protein SUGI_0897680 [Cryptomeria japonica]|nr:hypothetical protein SUGI_0897680 [Cryptomeria japonica]